MKMKTLLLVTLATLGLTAATTAQNNCELINSVTLNVPENDINVARFSNQRGPSLPYQYLTYNQWHHMAFTKENLNGKVFLDGVLVIDSLWGNFSYNWIALYLGAELFSGWSVFYNGMLDEIRVSNTVRSDSAIINGFLTNLPYSSDSNTMSLWHFDETSGSSFLNSVTGLNSGILYNGVTFQQGKFGNGVYFDGIDDRADCSFNMPENNFTVELWIKPLPQSNYACFMQPYGAFNSPMYLSADTITTNYTWSTGDSGNSVTLDPISIPYVWVSNGSCTDTIWFNSQSATIYDTTLVSVTDTLIINTLVTGVEPPNNSNTIKVYPNPANSHITIDYGNFTSLSGYQLKIINSLSQNVFQTNITQQSDYLNLTTWGGNGLYFVQIIDQQGNIIDIRKIVVQ
jgi:hypothetical protein